MRRVLDIHRGVLFCADGRPIILKNRKTAERFIAEMGMGEDWKIKEGIVSVRETRGRKPKSDPGVSSALLAWAMMKPKERPTSYDDQRAFMERFHGLILGNAIENERSSARLSRRFKDYIRRRRPILPSTNCCPRRQNSCQIEHFFVPAFSFRHIDTFSIYGILQ